MPGASDSTPANLYEAYARFQLEPSVLGKDCRSTQDFPDASSSAFAAAGEAHDTFHDEPHG